MAVAAVAVMPGVVYARVTLGVRDAAPVTLGEVRSVMWKVEKAFRAIESEPPSPAKPDTSSTKPATREDILLEMGKIYSISKPHFKFLPNPVKYDTTVFTIKSTSPARPVLERLVRLGFVGKVSVLASGNGDTMDPRQFGDAVGLFIARTAHLTHTPDPKHSAYLSGD